MLLLCTLLFIFFLTTCHALPSDVHARATCGGIASLTQCGGFYPADFCCPSVTQCLQLNVTGAVGVICCPSGVDCRTVQPTTCDPTAYDASKYPQNQIHISTAQNLTSCGSACCTSGFSCQNGNCVSITANSTQPVTTSSPSPSSSAQPTAAASLSVTTDPPSSEATFSGPIFAAGFVPGVAIGMLLLWFGIFLWNRRKTKRRETSSVWNSQAHPPEMLQRPPPPPTMAISYPEYHDYGGYRSDFLRTSPPDAINHSTSSESPEHHSSLPASTDLQPILNYEAAVLRSPSPIAVGHRALSFRFSPQGKLRNKASMHSLRRHMDAHASVSSIHRSDSSDSTGTIKIAMSPDTAWQGTPAAAPHTPTRDAKLPHTHLLGSPYTPSRYNDSYLEPPRSARRVTTFSSLMEKAGFRRRDFEDL